MCGEKGWAGPAGWAQEDACPGSRHVVVRRRSGETEKNTDMGLCVALQDTETIISGVVMIDDQEY
jgi:hypothetical protein